MRMLADTAAPAGWAPKQVSPLRGQPPKGKFPSSPASLKPWLPVAAPSRARVNPPPLRSRILLRKTPGLTPARGRLIGSYGTTWSFPLYQRLIQIVQGLGATPTFGSATSCD